MRPTNGERNKLCCFLKTKTSKLSFVAIIFILAYGCHNRPRVTFFIQKCYKMHCVVRLHGQNACYVIFWNIAPIP